MLVRRRRRRMCRMRQMLSLKKYHQHSFVGNSYWPRFTTVEQNRARPCLVDPTLYTQRYLTPRPNTELQPRECRTGSSTDNSSVVIFRHRQPLSTESNKIHEAQNGGIAPPTHKLKQLPMSGWTFVYDYDLKLEKVGLNGSKEQNRQLGNIKKW